jgi:hypothetical protein
MLKTFQRVDQSEALLFYAHPDKRFNENKSEDDSECVNGKMTVLRDQSGSVGAVEQSKWEKNRCIQERERAGESILNAEGSEPPNGVQNDSQTLLVYTNKEVTNRQKPTHIKIAFEPPKGSIYRLRERCVMEKRKKPNFAGLFVPRI